jgi:tetratricopeptide (TPR) repeat protein
MSFLGLGCLRRTSCFALGIVLAAAFPGLDAVFPAWAQQHAAKSVSGGSTNAALLDRAKRLAQGGDPQGALTLLDSVGLHGRLDDQDSSDIHALRGVCLALLARPVDSAAEFDAAIALRPNYAPTYFSAGLAFASFDNLDRALDRLSSALKLDPNLPGVRYNYALVLARAGRFAESERQAQIELDKPLPKSEHLLDLWRLKARDAYYQKEWTQALAAYRKAAQLDPDWPEAYGAMGEALFFLNRSEESRPMLEKSEALDPDNATTHALLGKLYQDAGETPMAVAELEAALRLRPDDQEAAYRLYRIYSRNGDAANAARTRTLLDNLIAKNYNESLSETKAVALNQAGLELETHGDLAGALGKFDQAAAADRTNLIFERNAALMLCKLGRAEEAIRRLRDILNLDPDDAIALQILAVAKESEARRMGKAPDLPSLEAAH